MLDDFVKHGRLTEQELYHVLRELNRYRSKARTAGVYSAGDKRIDKDSRDAVTCWATPIIAPYTFNILQSIVIQHYSHLPLDTTEEAEVQYTSYRVNGHFRWHQDIMPTTREDGRARGLTMSINLSESTEYTGGDLLAKLYDDEISLSREKGSYMIFPSFVRHQACRVDSGRREALVVWTYLTKEEIQWLKNQCVR